MFNFPRVSHRCTEEVFQALEDNQVTLSTMKSSRFVKAFEPVVDRWERQLSQVLEVIEMILNVQRHWIYLEVQEALGILCHRISFSFRIGLSSLSMNIIHYTYI